jgi:hypothetical protein
MNKKKYRSKKIKKNKNKNKEMKIRWGMDVRDKLQERNTGRER